MVNFKLDWPNHQPNLYEYLQTLLKQDAFSLSSSTFPYSQRFLEMGVFIYFSNLFKLV